MCPEGYFLKGMPHTFESNTVHTLYKYTCTCKNITNNFDPFVFFPDGEGYMLDPSYVKNRAPEDLHLGGVESRKRYVTPYPLRTPLPRGGLGR